MLCFISAQVFSQAVNAPLDNDYYHLLDRFEIINGSLNQSYHSAHKAYNRKEIAGFLDSINTSRFNRRDLFNYNYLSLDNWEWLQEIDYKNEKPILRHIYKAKTDFLNVHEEEFDLHINPVLAVGLGQESLTGDRLYTNTRGIEIRGSINNKIGFYTFLTENQALFPSHVNAYTREFKAVPNEGFWKNYGENSAAKDFFTARGYISLQATKNINLQFGHDRFFIGNGYRSLMLSDFSPAYLHLKAETKIWKFNYMNIFGLQTADLFTSGNTLTGARRQYPRKFMAMHHLSYNITKNINVGLFEAVMLGDSASAKNPIDINYLNPIIFYRSLEQQDGSAGNALVGADFRAIFLKSFSIYSQIVLDEFLIANIREGGWWANKYAVQAGIKYINAFRISNLDLQAEYNLVRPFTYAHDSNFTNFANYKQPLAHPLGANFKELIGIVRYQVTPRISIKAKLMIAEQGLDTANTNYGSNIFKANNTRVRFQNPASGSTYDFGHTTGQGDLNTIQFYQLNLTYQPYYNVFLDLDYSIRNQSSELTSSTAKNTYINASLRWNIPTRNQIF
ncbi:MAG: hypothetical protein ACJAT1_000734 [Marivirga sp.]|jgi:hypothetical protein